MNSSEDLRIIRFIDGFHYSFEILDYAYLSLHDTCCLIGEDNSNLIPALAKCWTFIDSVHRIRALADSVPGLSKRDKNYRQFYNETKPAKDFRNYIQHLRTELSKKTINPFPVWGSLAWVNKDDSSLSHIVIYGGQIENQKYSGCVFDMEKQDWVSKVSLVIKDLSIHFDPVYKDCITFKNFIIPWLDNHYKQDIKRISGLKIIDVKMLPMGNPVTRRD
ncbi:hypothetical protein J7L05_12560 [bacterium]|nr:hypothetical protein [bacterium]